MATPELRKIEEVHPRSIWRREDEDFTPWLAKNLDALSKLLELELKLIDIEKPAGQFFLDILAEESEGGKVAIENQLKWYTDHDHLGKLLTYAAWHEAEYVVWVAPQFTAEHRTTLDWLNSLGPDKVWFYGVEVRVIGIDDSHLAPDFRVVAAPKEWYGGTRDPKSLQPLDHTSEDNSSDVEIADDTYGDRYRKFFRQLIADLRELGFERVSQTTYGQHYQTVKSGIEAAAGGNVRYGISIDDIDEVGGTSKASVYLWVESRNSGIAEYDRNVFAALQDEQKQIESEIGTGLEWDDGHSWGSPTVSLYRDGSIDNPPEALEEIREWMQENLVRFRDVFKPHLEKILAELEGE